MTRTLRMLWLATGLACGSAWPQDRSERLTLGDGVTAVKDRIKGRDSVQYAFTAKPGQPLTVKLATSNPSAYLNVQKAGAAEAVCQGALTGNVCAVQAEGTTEYIVAVFLMRNAARRGESAKYTLSIEPSAGPSTTSGAARPSSAAH